MSIVSCINASSLIRVYFILFESYQQIDQSCACVWFSGLKFVC